MDKDLCSIRFVMRALREEEMLLITAMVRGRSVENIVIAALADAVVTYMDDGEMGSIRFHCTEGNAQRFGREVSHATYVDSDGVLVSIALNLDQCGNLFELDVWKVDSSPLRRFPHPDELTFVELNSKRSPD